MCRDRAVCVSVYRAVCVCYVACAYLLVVSCARVRVVPCKYVSLRVRMCRFVFLCACRNYLSCAGAGVGVCP